MYEVLLDPHAERQLDALGQNDYNRIEQVLDRLSLNPRPRGVQKLWDKVHRIRVGLFRIVYVIDDQDSVVLVSDVLRRSEGTYRRLE